MTSAKAAEVYFALLVVVMLMQVAKESALRGAQTQITIKAADELQLHPHLHLRHLFGKLRNLEMTKYPPNPVKSCMQSSISSHTAV